MEQQTSTILIVDDMPEGRQTLEAMLIPEHYQLLFASSGEEALELAASHVPDLVLLDVMMPGMDGFEVCHHLRADPLLSEVPIIMVTALDDRSSRLEGIESGADDFISKPLDRAELRARVRTVTRLNRYRRLLNERARFEQLIELSPDGVLIVDSASTILLANTAIAAMLGVETSDQLIGQHILRFIVPDKLDHCSLCLHNVIQGRTPAQRMETVFKRVEGEVVPVEVNAGGLTWENQPTVQLLVRDITERKLAEDENIRLVQKLADRERRLQDLVEKLLVSQEEERRRVAYELHDGLAQTASGAHQHLQTFSTLYVPEEPRAIRELDRALNLSQQVVKEARQVISGMRPTVLDDFGLASALRMEVERLRADGWDVRYEESTQAERLPSTIETAFFRVAQEALTNVQKHAQTRQVRLALRYDEQNIHLEVQDWGHGFDPASLPEATTGGEHIGLIGMEERVTLLGGTFQIRSQPASGTLVVAEAPLPAPKDEPSAADTVEVAGSQHVARLIIADDHDLSRAGIRSMLAEEKELELVGEATNGREAVEMCQSLHPDLALLDIRMPEMDGLQATRAIKQVSPDTSVIIVTMHENADYLVAAIRAGAAGYLLKDTSRREFLSAVRRVLRGESFLNTDLTQRLLHHMSSDQTNKQADALPEPLTPRERDVLQLIIQGLTNREIAKRLIISALTVKVHVSNIISKLGVSDRTQAAVRAVELGLHTRTDVSSP